MNYDLAQSILLITKIKVIKFPVSRRLKTWNNNIFTDLCPFGCGVEDNEEHAFLNCKVTIIKDLKKVILDGLKEISIKDDSKRLSDGAKSYINRMSMRIT